jgi:hypothetical protein
LRRSDVDLGGVAIGHGDLGPLMNALSIAGASVIELRVTLAGQTWRISEDRGGSR